MSLESIYVVDDFFDPVFLETLYFQINDRYGWNYGRSSYGDAKDIAGERAATDREYFCCSFFEWRYGSLNISSKDKFQEFMLRYLESKISVFFTEKVSSSKGYRLDDLLFNGRTSTMTDAFHPDYPYGGSNEPWRDKWKRKNYTFNLFLHPGGLKEGGGLIIKEGDRHIQFKQNRAVIFESKLEHKVDDFKDPNTFRVTMTSFGEVLYE